VALLGLAIGWMVGLSTSPVVASVITTLLGLAGAVVTILGGIKKPDDETDGSAAIPTANPAPIALLAVTIALAATAGAYTRINTGSLPSGNGENTGLGGISLFSVTAESCAEILRAPNETLANTVAQEAGDDAILAALGTSTDPALLRAAVTQLCAD
jgi:hypothetical protein